MANHRALLTYWQESYSPFHTYNTNVLCALLATRLGSTIRRPLSCHHAPTTGRCSSQSRHGTCQCFEKRLQVTHALVGIILHAESTMLEALAKNVSPASLPTTITTVQQVLFSEYGYNRSCYLVLATQNFSDHHAHQSLITPRPTFIANSNLKRSRHGYLVIFHKSSTIGEILQNCFYRETIKVRSSILLECLWGQQHSM